jgi:hypothetical protein
MQWMSFVTLRRVSLCVVLLTGGTLAAQQTTPPTSDQRRAGGEKSIVGCLTKGDYGFVVKAADGNYELNTDRDLSALVGKQVKIESKWELTGTMTNAAMQNPAGSTPAAPPAGAAAPGGAGTPAFVGDLHLHITGTVIGDCATPK